MFDWQAGDLALCVSNGEYRCEHGFHWQGIDCPDVGTIHEVTAIISDKQEAVREGYDEDEGCDCLALIFDSFGNVGGHSIRFVKVTPPEDMELDSEGVSKPEKVTQ